jgi:hypothetical protein
MASYIEEVMGKRRPNGTKPNSLRLAANASETAPAIDDSFVEHVSNTLVFTLLGNATAFGAAGRRTALWAIFSRVNERILSGGGS